MAHRLPNEKDTFVVNDFRDGNFVSGDGYWDKNFYDGHGNVMQYVDKQGTIVHNTRMAHSATRYRRAA